MALLLILIFIVLPVAEIYVIIKVGEAIGVLPTIALLILDGFLGAALLRHQGRAAWRRFNEALEEVIDPELGLDFVSLGLVYDVEVKDADVYVTFTLTYPGCPIGPQVSEQMKEFVGDIDGVESVYPKMVFDPPWTPDMMSEDAKFALGY